MDLLSRSNSTAVQSNFHGKRSLEQRWIRTGTTVRGVRSVHWMAVRNGAMVEGEQHTR